MVVAYPYYYCCNDQPYIKIKAGKCTLELTPGSEDSYTVTPLIKKGQLSLVKGR
jgi:hypothetical protein